VPADPAGIAAAADARLAKKPQATLVSVIGHARFWAMLLVFLPAASRADVAEVPELGVKFSALPSGVSPFQVVERPAGYEATAHLGIFSLSIYRLEEAVPAGSDLRDAGYRATLETKLGIKAGSLKEGAAKRFGDYDAWTIGSSQARIGAITLYSWTTYAIGDQHLYRLSVGGAGPTATAEFESLLKGVHSVAFGPVQRAPPPPLESAASAPGKMPRFVAAGDALWYPAVAQRLGEQGPVDIEFSVDGLGRVQNLNVAYEAAHDLRAPAERFFHNGVFRVPPDWEATGSDKQRFAAEFQFVLVGPGQSCPRAQPARVADAPVVVVICGSVIAGRPSR